MVVKVALRLADPPPKERYQLSVRVRESDLLYNWRFTAVRLGDRHIETKKKLRGFSPEVNYTDRVAASCR
jgi:hypothetical protein